MSSARHMIVACHLLRWDAGISAPDHGNTNAHLAIILRWVALCVWCLGASGAR